jgi:Putative threonine/serine exporter
VPSDRDDRSGDADAQAGQFVAALGATMAAANYPVTLVRRAMDATSKAYGLDHQFLALPNYVQVGSATGDGLYIVNPDFELRYDQSFPLAELVERAPTGTLRPADGMAELQRIRNLDNRFPAWLTVVGYAVQSLGLVLILQPTPWTLVGAATLRSTGGRVERAGTSRRSRRRHAADPLRVSGRVDRGLNFAPPTRFLPWMALMLYTAYAGQWIGKALLGSFASGFGGGLTLILFAVGAGSIGLHGRHPATRHAQHRRVHRHADRNDVDRGGRADRTVVVAGHHSTHTYTR